MSNQVIVGFKERTMEIGSLVKVHRNLNNGLWSVTAKTGEYKNKVVHHCANISISNVKFVISDAGRKRVLRENRKNVHAWCVGILTSVSEKETIPEISKQVTYDPYKHGFFYQADAVPTPFMELDALHFIGTKAYTHAI